MLSFSVCRDFFGPTISGIVTNESNFAWTMTFYSFGCLAIIAAILLLKLFQAIKSSHNKIAYTSLLPPKDDMNFSKDSDNESIIVSSPKENITNSLMWLSAKYLSFWSARWIFLCHSLCLIFVFWDKLWHLNLYSDQILEHKIVML